ncbi:MAG: hypothetical protein K5872_02795 [Rhizobiaceae bacterium]|nr:hypothetical protein [Rhizobiaceae bacterium]MCV0405137.1 hypothetical protein [Rhizobiaceae bacterium]
MLVPAIGMQVSDEWNWGPFDFVFAAALLFGATLVFELVGRSATTAYRTAVGVAVATAVFLVWINAAVGIIGDDEPYNLMYFGVLAIGLAGALAARLRPQGMALALVAMAVAQMLVPTIVLAVPDFRGVLAEPPGVLGVFILNACLAALWLTSGWLFRRAAAAPPG